MQCNVYHCINGLYGVTIKKVHSADKSDKFELTSVYGSYISTQVLTAFIGLPLPLQGTPLVLKPWDTGGMLSIEGMSTARFSVMPERESGIVEEDPMLDWMEQASTTVPTPALFTEEAR